MKGLNLQGITQDEMCEITQRWVDSHIREDDRDFIPRVKHVGFDPEAGFSLSIAYEENDDGSPR